MLSSVLTEVRLAVYSLDMTEQPRETTVIITVDDDSTEDSFRLLAADLRWEAAHAEFYAAI